MWEECGLRRRPWRQGRQGFGAGVALSVAWCRWPALSLDVYWSKCQAYTTGQMLHHDTCTVQNEHLTAQGACRVSCEPPLPSPSTKPHRDGSRAGGLQLPVANGSSSCNRQGQVSRISGVVPLIPPPTADGLIVDQPALSTPSISPVLAGVRCLRN